MDYVGVYIPFTALPSMFIASKKQSVSPAVVKEAEADFEIPH